MLMRGKGKGRQLNSESRTQVRWVGRCRKDWAWTSKGRTDERAGRCSQARPSLTLCVIRPSLRSEPTRPRSEMQKKKKEQVNPRRFLR